MKILKGKTPEPRRTLLYGIEGVGKSTWAAQAPSPIFMDIEGGLNDIDCAKSERITTLEEAIDEVDFKSCLRWLASEGHDFKTLVVDSLDWLETLVWKDVAAKAGKATIEDIGYGAGYKNALVMWNEIISWMEYLRTSKGMGIILLAHSTVVRFQDPESEAYDRYIPDMHKDASALMREYCDEVFFASYKTYTKQEDQGFNKKRTIGIGSGERYLRTSESAAVAAKNRLSLPDELPMVWSEYAKHFEPAGNIVGGVVDGSSKKTSVKGAK